GKSQEQSRAESVAELGSASSRLIIISFSETRFVCCIYEKYVRQTQQLGIEKERALFMIPRLAAGAIMKVRPLKL
ncbi:hypothetical protein TSAR_006045, partial [Trichomalopsis sarcophagae]